MPAPYYQDNMRAIYNADCRSMAEVPEGSIQCCVTSPPYWGLRKYAAPDMDFGGEPGCSHDWQTEDDARGTGNGESFRRDREAGIPRHSIETSNCLKCGAWRGQFGLEPSIDLYIEHTIDIMREIRRVLQPDGVLFWNIGDSYAGAATGSYGMRGNLQGGTKTQAAARISKKGDGIKPKDMCLIPFRVALAAQADGWWVRSDIIWNKPNPMPESVTDRPTDAYEHIFMFTKSARYYWDPEAVKEAKAESTVGDIRGNSEGQRRERNYPGAQSNGGTNLGGPYGGRNLRNVWTFPTQGYSEAHFATFPEELPERCIKAATKEGDMVLDPFAGSGTTLLVAARLGRRSVGYEISPGYCELIRKRNNQHVLVATAPELEAVAV